MMSIQESVRYQQNLSKAEIEEKNENNCSFSLKKANIIIIIQNYKINSTKNVLYESLNKNGSEKIEIKRELKYSKDIESPNKTEKTLLNNLKYPNIKSSYSKTISKSYEKLGKDFNSNNLEFKRDYLNEFGNFRPISNYQNHIFKINSDEESYSKMLAQYPSISSSLFTKRTEEANYFDIDSKNGIIRKLLSKSSEPSSLLLNNDIKKKRLTLNSNLMPKNINLKKEIKEHKNLNFNVPENFLVNYNLKEIKINHYQFNSNVEKSLLFLYLEDMEKYINCLCQKIINENENRIIFEEYIECKKFFPIKENNITFLQQKLKSSLYFDDIDIYNNKYKKRNSKKRSINKKFKNKKISEKIKKINNKKDGVKINIYLNQIQINKNKLENFPFLPMIGNKENTKIEFLKGVIDNKRLIKINKKTEIIKDKRNLNYINNKKFEITYINNENDKHYILNIKGLNILHLILYYYYQIQEGIKLMNKYHYCHASFEKSKKIIKHIEGLIKKCNKLTSDITK